jgi:LmbE family N-acetylglucosaminyl deacetylase
MEPEEIIKVRRQEAMDAAKLIGATFHESLANDLEIFYNQKLLSEVTAVVREIGPEIILTQYPFEYMEDHSNSCRLAVSAAFFRGMKNFKSTPPQTPYTGEVAVYHSLPYGLMDPLCNKIKAGLYTDVSEVMNRKKAMLACHKSQKEWLDISQGMNSYIKNMTEMNAEIGKMSGCFKYAEGWCRHLPLGLGMNGADPLSEALEKFAFISPDYEQFLKGQ